MLRPGKAPFWKLVGLVLGWLSAVPILGYVGVSYFNWSDRAHESLFSETGAVCTVVALIVVLIAAILTRAHYNRVVSTAMADPHHPDGQRMRREIMPTPDAPPPIRNAYDGGRGNSDGMHRE